VILEGESLLNDATALLIYRIAVDTLSSGGFSILAVAPSSLIAIAGSVIVGPALAWLVMRATRRVEDIPTAIILQFISTFGVWILAERLGLSAILTMVTYAVAVARRAPELTPPRIRIPSYAVWDTVVFVLNALAFVFIGLQVRPILATLDPTVRMRYVSVAAAVLFTAIVIRFVWVMTHNTIVRWKIRRFGFHPARPTQPPSIAGGLIVSWCGMRGIVSLAAALALPVQIDGAPFPFRDLILVTAFGVVLGTLLLQGLTLKPLLRALRLRDDDLVEREVLAVRERALQAALDALSNDSSESARAVRQEFAAHLRRTVEDGRDGRETVADHQHIHARAVAAARRVNLDMRASNDIGDDAFHRLEEELDWIEMGSGGSSSGSG